MALSLQNQIVGDTYTQLVHTGSPNLTGNNMYAADGTSISYYINDTCFDFTEPGVIKGDLTVNTLLSGTAFGTYNNPVGSTTTCIFGKNNSTGSGCNIIMLGGLSSHITGCNIRSINTYGVCLSTTSVFGVHTVVGGACSQYLTPGACVSDVIGGWGNYLSAAKGIISVGGQNNNIRVLDNCLYNINNNESIFYGNSNDYLPVSTDRLSAINIASIAPGGLYASGSQNSYGNVQNIHAFTGQCVIYNTPIGTTTYLTKVTSYSGKNIYFDNICGCGTLTVHSFTGQNQTFCLDSGSLMVVMPLNGNNINITQRTTGQILVLNGDGVDIDAVSTTRVYFLNGLSSSIYGICSPTHVNGRYNCLSSMSTSSSCIINGEYNTTAPVGISTGILINGCNINTTGGIVYTGLSSTIYKESRGIIMTGMQNTICVTDANYQRCDIILTGCNNYILDTYNGHIINGSNNSICCCALVAQHHQILGGNNNNIEACYYNSHIMGGEGNYICKTSGTALIIGGRNNTAIASTLAIIGSGLSASRTQANHVNNLIITDLPVGCTGLYTKSWYRDIGDDIIRITV